MTRNEVYSEIRSIHGLAEAISAKEGRNYTNVKTEVLEQYVTAAKAEIKAHELPKEEQVDAKKSALENAVLMLLIHLEKKGLLGTLLDKIRG